MNERPAATTADILPVAIANAPAPGERERIQPDEITRHGQPVCADCRKPYRWCRCGFSED